MYKGKKYNIIIFLLIFIISAVVGVSAGMSPSAGFPLNPDTDSGEIVMPPEEEVPSGISPPATNASPLRKIAFAIDIMNNGKGYQSRTTQTLDIHALNLQQYMRFSKYRGGGLDLTEEWFKFSGTGVLASSGKNEYRSVLSNGTTMREKLIEDTSKFSFDSKTVDYSDQGTVISYPNSEYTGTRNRMPINDFFIEVKNEYVSSIKEDKRTDANNYIITVIFNTSAIPARYLSAFSENGGTGTQITSLKLTFHISKTTGYLRKVRKDEQFVSSQGPFSSNCTTTLEEEFLYMNKSFENEIKKVATESFGVNF